MDHNNQTPSSDPHVSSLIKTKPLILVISPSQDRQDVISNCLVDYNYQIGGPFTTVDEGYAFSKDHQPELIIFDAINSQKELLFFAQMLKKALTDLPVLVIHKEDNFAIDHSLVDFLVPPFDSQILELKIRLLLKREELSNWEEAELILKFVNQLIDSLVLQAPESTKGELVSMIHNALLNLTEKNSEIEMKNPLKIKLEDNSTFDTDTFIMHFKEFLKEIIDDINYIGKTNWGQSFVQDTLSSLVVSQKNLAPALQYIFIEMGVNVNEIRNSLASAIPEYHTLKKHVAVLKLTLSDSGPELREIVSDDQELKSLFDDGVASQILTLVGQGSSYHQGIFGPIPIPRSQKLVAILWSKLMLSDIIDHRMEGKTLVAVVIAMRRELLNRVPVRDKLEAIFEPLESLTHEMEITNQILKEIEFRYENQLM